jgi:hypothetical protein
MQGCIYLVEVKFGSFLQLHVDPTCARMQLG